MFVSDLSYTFRSVFLKVSFFSFYNFSYTSYVLAQWSGIFWGLGLKSTSNVKMCVNKSYLEKNPHKVYCHIGEISALPAFPSSIWRTLFFLWAPDSVVTIHMYMDHVIWRNIIVFLSPRIVPSTYVFILKGIKNWDWLKEEKIDISHLLLISGIKFLRAEAAWIITHI